MNAIIAAECVNFNERNRFIVIFFILKAYYYHPRCGVVMFSMTAVCLYVIW